MRTRVHPLHSILVAAGSGLAASALSPASADEFVFPESIVAVPSRAAPGPDAPGPDDWLHVLNIPLSLNQALSGRPIATRGWANLDPRQSIDLTFAAPLRNGEGADLIFMEARFDNGAFAIASDYDGFVSEIGLRPDVFVATGTVFDYFYGNNPGGPFRAEVYAVSIDLSRLGVPLGESVLTVRIEAVNAGTDPLGVGTLARLDVGGTVTGVDATAASCTNLSTGRSAEAPVSRGAWDCESSGLPVSPGDVVSQEVQGTAVDANRVAGDVGGITPDAVTCTNLTTGQQVQLDTRLTGWKCVRAGLIVTPGDTILQTVLGTVQE